MLPETNLGEKTRRAVLKAAGAALGVAAVGTSIAHPGHLGEEDSKFYGGTEGYLGDNVADASENVELVGYHSAGGVGPASSSGRAEDAHHGAMTEFRVHDDLAFVGFLSGRGEDSQRGMGIFDISDFTRAESESELEAAGLTLLSFVRNDNPSAAVMDVKVTDGGDYVFMAKQTVTALFGESHQTQPNADNHGTSPGSGSLAAVDVSDPGNPTVTSEIGLSHWSVGPHNCWYHQIGGSEYVFTVHGTTSAASKTNVFEFDRSTGQLYQVNAFSWDTNVATGEYGADSNQWYHHDIQVQEDPRTGIPLAYLHCWDAGLRIFDVSDPTDVSEVGVFEQNAAHHAVPGPALIDGKRVAVTGNENPHDSRQDRISGDGGGETGRYNLVDCDPLDLALTDDPDQGGDPDVEKVYLGVASPYQTWADEDPDSRPLPLTRAPYQMYEADENAHVVRDDDGSLQNELDDWVLINGDAGEGWEDAPGFEEEAELAAEDPDGEDEGSPGEYDGFTDFRISTHNLDMDTEGRVYAGHYHAGMRAFQIVSPGEDDEDGQSNGQSNAQPNGRVEGTPAWENAEAFGGSDDGGWQLAPAAYFRDGKEIPRDAAIAFDTPGDPPQDVDGLTASTPFFWNGVGRNGVVFSGGINSGPHVMRETHDTAAEVGWDTPLDVDIEREHDVPVTLSEQSTRVTITADSDEDVIVRDAVPIEWDVHAERSPDVLDVHEIDGYRKIVSLEVTDGEATYLVESPADSGSYTFGPVEYARATDEGYPDVDSHYGGGNSTTNRLWRKDNAAVESIGALGL